MRREPAGGTRHLIGMTALLHVPGFMNGSGARAIRRHTAGRAGSTSRAGPVPGTRAARRARAATLAGAALAGGTCLLIAGCSGGVSAPASTASGEVSHSGAGTGTAGTGASGPRAGPLPAGRSSGARLAALPAAGGAEIIKTAALTVRARQVAVAASQAAQLAGSAGGYVSGEQTMTSANHRGQGTVLMQLKIPAAAYQATLTAASRLGTTLSESQHSQDVTQTVADVSSRVTSAQTAIGQLRRLLARAGGVSSLLSVQEEINSQESSLEALQAQQRALARETTFSTISLDLVGPPAGPVKHRRHHAGGFTGGLLAGWRALRTVAGGLLTGAGAALPFVIPLALLAAGAYGARRWRVRRHAEGGGPGSAAAG
jgi:hypothetical protein